jgi:hypothetical protein
MSRLLTTREAAAAVWVPVRTVETWTARGLVRPLAPGLYLEEDVADAERSTRRRPRLDRLIAISLSAAGSHHAAADQTH